MGIALAVYLAGMALVITYVATVYRAWSGKVDDDTSGHY